MSLWIWTNVAKRQGGPGFGFDSQPEGVGVAFFATGPGLGLIMYILTTLEFPKHNHDLHLLTTSVNAKYFYWDIVIDIGLTFRWPITRKVRQK